MSPRVKPDALAQMIGATDAEIVAELGGTPADRVVVAHVVVGAAVLIDGCAHTPPNDVTRFYGRGDVLPEGIRPEVLTHLANRGLVQPVPVPIGRI